MQVVRIETDNGSTYLVGPSPTIPDHIRVARLSDHAVLGVTGPTTFALDVTSAELVADGAVLRLRWVATDGGAVQTSPVRDVSTWEARDLTATPA